MIQTYQKELRDVVEKSTLTYPDTLSNKLALHALALAGESGEIANKVKKVQWYNTAIDKQDIAEELGDVLWHVAEMASVLDVTLDDIARISLNKTIERNKECSNES